MIIIKLNTFFFFLFLFTKYACMSRLKLQIRLIISSLLHLYNNKILKNISWKEDTRYRNNAARIKHIDTSKLSLIIQSETWYSNFRIRICRSDFEINKIATWKSLITYDPCTRIRYKKNNLTNSQAAHRPTLRSIPLCGMEYLQISLMRFRLPF